MRLLLRDFNPCRSESAVGLWMTLLLLTTGCAPSKLSPETEATEDHPATAAALAGTSKHVSSPRLLGVMPPFELIDQDGVAVRNQRYHGRVWVAN
ncbi:MAG: hypothetical protein SFV23_15385, partial [Planctomycetaceae bacterium]|nr:hypothetical protein [Planctomycetaceae bacterium]